MENQMLSARFPRSQAGVAISKDFTVMQHLINAMAAFAAETLDPIDGGQAEIGGFDGQTAKIAGHGRIIIHQL
jgi:hypothetical protein